VFGWEEKDLLLGSQQKTLFDDFDPPRRSAPRKPADEGRAPPAPGRKGTALDDFP
jgi:hypothetical protein